MAYRIVKTLYNKIFHQVPRKPPYNHVCQVGDPVLRMMTKNVHVEEISHNVIQEVIRQMIKVMKQYKSSGLAAPQIGIPLRIFLMELPKSIKNEWKPEIYSARDASELPLTIFINPKMKVLNYDKIILEEGCESVRGHSAHVPRYKSVEVSGWNRDGEQFSKTFSGWLARIAQHEMDHLDGRLYIDKIDMNTFQNSAWHKINVHEGKIKIKFK